MKLKYTGPHDEVEVPALGAVVKQGATLDVPADIAGRAPSTSKDDDGNDVIDPGEGLLAQPDNWQAVTTAKTRKES